MTYWKKKKKSGGRNKELKSKIDQYQLENNKISALSKTVNANLIECSNDINFSKVNLKYKIEELKIIEESIKIHTDKNKLKINENNPQDPRIDYSSEEGYFRELKNTVQLSMQNIKASNTSKFN